MNQTTNPIVAAVAAFAYAGVAQVQLTADSPEQLLAALAKFGISHTPPAATPAPAGNVAPIKTTKDAKKAETAAAAPPPAAAATKPSAAPAPAAAPTGDAVDYATLQKAVFKLAGVPELGRPACTELLAGLGVATFKDLPSEQWADALAKVQAKTAELENAAAVA